MTQFANVHMSEYTLTCDNNHTHENMETTYALLNLSEVNPQENSLQKWSFNYYANVTNGDYVIKL